MTTPELLKQATARPWKANPDLNSGAHNHWTIVAKSPHVDGLAQTIADINGPWQARNYQANAQIITQAVNEYEALCAVADAIQAMRHDINIFYAKYRETDGHGKSVNQYKIALDSALSTLANIRKQS